MKRYAFAEEVKKESDKKYKIIIVVCAIVAVYFIIITPIDDIDLSTFPGIFLAAMMVFGIGAMYYISLLMVKAKNILRDELVITDSGINGKYCINYSAFKPTEISFSAKYDEILKVELEAMKDTRYSMGYFLIIHCKKGIYRLYIPDAYDAKTDIEFNMQHSIHT